MDETLLQDFDTFTAPTSEAQTDVVSVTPTQEPIVQKTEEVDPVLSDFDSFAGTTEQQPTAQIDPIDQHRPPEVDDETWNDVKSRIPKFLDTKASNPIMKSLLKDVGLTEDFKKIEEPSIVKNTAEAYKLKALNENIETEYGDLKKLYDASVNGDKEAQKYLSEKQETLNNEVVKALRTKGIEAYYDKGELFVVGKDEDGNEIAKSLDESTIKSIIAGFGASSGEMGGGISGAMAGASAGFKAGGFDPRKKLLGATVGGLAGGYAGSAIGKYADLLRATTELNKKLSAREYIEKSTAAGVADTFGAMGVGVVAKGVSKAVEPLKKASQRVKTLYKDGNIKGAMEQVKKDYTLTDNDIDEMYKSMSKDITGLEDLTGDDLLRAKISIAVQNQAQGASTIQASINKNAKAAIETSKEIDDRAKQVLNAAEQFNRKPSAIRKSVEAYEKIVGKNYGEVRNLIDEALPNYKPDLNVMSFSETLTDLNTRVIDPLVKEKLANLSTTLANQKVNSVGDLIETRQLFNKFYGKNQGHFESKVDKETLMSIQKTIDIKIDEAISTIPNVEVKEIIDGEEVLKTIDVSSQLKNAFKDAKKKYSDMFNTQDTAAYNAIFKKDSNSVKRMSEEDIGKALITYSKSASGDLEPILNKLSPVQRTKSEFSIINQMVKNATSKEEAKAIDFIKLISDVKESEAIFKTPEAKQFIKNIEGYDKKFGKDITTQRTAMGIEPRTETNIAVSPIGKAKVMGAKKAFESFQRLLNTDRGRRLSIQHAIGTHLEKSRTPKEFLFNVSKIKNIPDQERLILKNAIKDINRQEAKLKQEAIAQATKNEESILKAKEAKAKQATEKVLSEQEFKKAKWEKAKKEAETQKLNEQARKAKEAKEPKIGGSEDEAKQAVKNVFAKNTSEEAKYKNMSKADIAEQDRLHNENIVKTSEKNVELGDKTVSKKTYTFKEGKLEIFKNSPYAQGRNSINTIEVDSLAKNKGIGTKLIESAKDDFENISAQVSNAGAVEFFYKQGFRPTIKKDATVQEAKKMFKENGESLNMEWRLSEEASKVFAKGVPEVISGTIAGVEQDEQGNITLDPEKFLLGVLGVSSIRGLNKAYKNSPKTQAKVEKALRSLASDSTRVAGDMIEKINKQIGLNIEPNIVAKTKGITPDKTCFKGACDRIRAKEGGEEFWQKMMDTRKQISEKEFLKNVNTKDLLDEGETWADYKKTASMEGEPLRFYASDNGVFHIQHAGFEFIWESKVPHAEMKPKVFTSKLEESLTESKQKTWNVEQLKGFLNKQGIKADEMKWSGLDDYLEGKTKVSTDELLSNMNQPKLEKTVLGGVDGEIKKNVSEMEKIFKKYEVTPSRDSYQDKYFGVNEYKKLKEAGATNEELKRMEILDRDRLDLLFSGDNVKPVPKQKYEKYSTHGVGTNYREELTTLSDVSGITQKIKKLEKAEEVLTEENATLWRVLTESLTFLNH
jgi:hypothetical protein